MRAKTKTSVEPTTEQLDDSTLREFWLRDFLAGSSKAQLELLRMKPESVLNLPNAGC